MDHILIFKIFITLVTGFVAGFVGTNAGGATLLVIPTLIFMGFAPAMAIATARFGALGAISAGLYGFERGGKVNYRIGIPGAIVAIFGTLIGANLLAILSSHILYRIVGVLSLLLLSVIIIRNAGLMPRYYFHDGMRIPIWRHVFGLILFFLLGVFGGIFGGQSIFATYILILVFGETFLESAGTRKIVGLTISVTALIIYSVYQFIDWYYGIALIIAMSAGSYIGAVYGLRRGDKWVRRLFVVVVFIMAARLLMYR